jgi:hypothetical protein
MAGIVTAIDAASVEQLIDDWPDTARTAARTILERYGLPHEATRNRLIWHGNGPWKRTVITREEVPHNFPKPHKDVLEQFVDYHVPPDKADELAAFDGSVIVERTKGELSARCDKEEMNFLALNLSHDVVTGRRTVDEARRAYTEKAMASMMKRSDEERYTEGFQFELPTAGTADLDETTIEETMLAKAKEAVGLE